MMLTSPMHNTLRVAPTTTSKHNTPFTSKLVHPSTFASPPTTPPPRPLASSHKSTTRIHATANDDLEEIDPMTGMPLASGMKAVLAPKTIQLPTGLTLSYRQADVNAALATPDKLPVLCLHGIGSSSYCYRNTIRLLGEAGHKAVAVDWPGHGDSGENSSGGYDADAMIAAIDAFVGAMGLDKQSFAVIVHGYVLGQYGMLYALRNSDKIAKLIILNTPVGLKSKLRPELAAYKSPLPFMRPKPGSTFAGDMFNAAGSPYAMQGKDADVYAAPYLSSPAKSAVIEEIMSGLDFQALLTEVDEGFRTWRQPSLVLFGTSDTFLNIKEVLEWLESKRTSMKMSYGVEAKLGHMPQEDYPDAIHGVIVNFFQGAA